MAPQFSAGAAPAGLSLSRAAARMTQTLTALTLGLLMSTTAAAEPASVVDVCVPAGRVTYINLLTEAIREGASAFGLKFVYHEAFDNAARQLEQVGAPEALPTTYVVRPVDGLDPQRLVEQVRPKGSPIIIFSTAPEQKVIDSYDEAWFVGTSNAAAGRLYGKAITDYLKKHRSNYDINHSGRLEVLVLRGPRGNSNDEARYAGLKAALEHAGYDYTIVHEAYCDWLYEPAFHHVSKLLQDDRFKDADLVAAMNDEMALAVIDALEQSGRDPDLPRLPIFGADGLRDALFAIQSGELTATLMHDVATTTSMILSIAAGERDFDVLSRRAGIKVDNRRVLLPPLLVTEQNVKQILKTTHR